jgi:hypothetical protein
MPRIGFSGRKQFQGRNTPCFVDQSLVDPLDGDVVVVVVVVVDGARTC